MLAALMQLADTTIVNVALPTIDGALGASTDEGAWFITAYIIANVIVIPLSPWLQTMLGRRNYFALSIAGFTVTSVLCGLANDATTEIALRFVQGAFGGGLMVPAQQIIRDTFPPAKLAVSQSLFALAVVLGPTIGPTLGRHSYRRLTWRWVFFVNLLPGILATVLVLTFVRDPAPGKRTAFDFFGITLLAIGLGCLQYVLDEGERNGWFDDTTIALDRRRRRRLPRRIRLLGTLRNEEPRRRVARLREQDGLGHFRDLPRGCRRVLRDSVHSAAVVANVARIYNDARRHALDDAGRRPGVALPDHDLDYVARALGHALLCGRRHFSGRASRASCRRS